MIHLPQLITDLGLILIVAAIVTIVFKKLRQPVVLGYILAGLLVGPHVPFFPTVTDPENIKVWGEIGVIFLLFALGLEFSFRKLARVGGAASITALVEVVAMVVIGVLVGRLLGWSSMDSVFLGGILAISSTTIIIRAFEETGVKGKAFASLVFGVLIVEDLFAIVLLVLLSALAARNEIAGVEMLMTLVKLGFLLLIWFLLGIFILPTALKHLRKLLNSETLLLLSIGLCFGMVLLATAAGYSPALGAFVMGSLLAETIEAERIEHLIQPVKDLFAAIFFVSVGMLIEPEVLVRYAGPIALITFVTIFGKLASTSLGALMSGQSLKTSVQAGFSMAQIGEFSFIIAALGQSLGVTSNTLYPIAVGVSAITTLSTPYMIRSSAASYSLIERMMPVSWRNTLTGYGSSIQRASATSEWWDLLRAYAIRLVVNAALITGVFLLIARVANPLFFDKLPSKPIAEAVSLTLALVFSAPFIWALTISPVQSREVLTNLWTQRQFRLAIVALEIGRLLFTIALFAFLIPQVVSWRVALVVTGLLLLIMLIFFGRYVRRVYQWFETRFVENLSEKENHAKPAEVPALAPWDAHLTSVTVPPESLWAGRSLQELAIRETFGVSIALIQRGHLQITAPSRGERVFPGDQLSVIGTDDQIGRFSQAVRSTLERAGHESKPSNFTLHQLRIEENSGLAGVSIRESGLREKIHGLVVGIEREGRRILNPDSTTTIQVGDLLWIVGRKDLLQRL